MRSDVDIAIVGAGPAGMIAASAAAAAGAAVAVLDEQAEPGGQIYKSIETVGRYRPADLSFLGEAYAHGAAVAAKFRAAHVDYRPGATVWQVGAPVKGRRELIYSRDGKASRLAARYLILATGALERPVPIPGWTLPGVMTVGAVQAALKAAGIYPAGRLVLAGSGPLLLQLAAQLIAARIPLAAIVGTTPPGAMNRAIFELPRAGLAAEYLLKGSRLLRTIRQSGVPFHRGASHLAVSGSDRATGLSFVAGGRLQAIDADLVALHEGVIPNTQLTRLVGARHHWEKWQRCFAPVLDQWGESSEAGIYVAGDGGGVAGARAAERSGTISGLAIAGRLGLISESERDLVVEEQRLRRFVDNSARRLLDRVYPAPDWIGSITDDVVVCRCEEVTAGQVRAVVADGCPGPNQAKAFLRCGMGPCQGRICASVVSEVIAAAAGRPVANVGSYRVRPPIKPVSLGEMAALGAA